MSLIFVRKVHSSRAFVSALNTIKDTLTLYHVPLVGLCLGKNSICDG